MAESLAKKYPKYYKSVPPGVPADEVDTYVINMMFPVDDPTGTVLHARKKLLIPGVRSGGKTLLKDVIEARDTLNRYIALMGDDAVEDVRSFDTMVWYKHTGAVRPEGVKANDMVAVKLVDGTENPEKRADFWIWAQDSTTSAIAEFCITRKA